MTTLVYFLSFISIIIFSVMVVTVTSPILSVCCLIVVFLNSAALLLDIGLFYVGLTLIIIYVGAVALLLLFVLMMLDLKDLPKSSNLFKNLPLVLFFGAFFLGFLPNFTPFQGDPISTLLNLVAEDTVYALNITDLGITAQINQLSSMGISFYSMDSQLLILCGIILLSAMIGSLSVSGVGNTSLTNSPESDTNKNNAATTPFSALWEQMALFPIVCSIHLPFDLNLNYLELSGMERVLTFNIVLCLFTILPELIPIYLLIF